MVIVREVMRGEDRRDEDPLALMLFALPPLRPFFLIPISALSLLRVLFVLCDPLVVSSMKLHDTPDPVL